MNTLGLVNVLNNDGNVLIDVAQMVDSHIQNAAIHNALAEWNETDDPFSPETTQRLIGKLKGEMPSLIAWMSEGNYPKSSLVPELLAYVKMPHPLQVYKNLDLDITVEDSEKGPAFDVKLSYAGNAEHFKYAHLPVETDKTSVVLSIIDAHDDLQLKNDPEHHGYREAVETNYSKLTNLIGEDGIDSIRDFHEGVETGKYFSDMEFDLKDPDPSAKHILECLGSLEKPVQKAMDNFARVTTFRNLAEKNLLREATLFTSGMLEEKNGRLIVPQEYRPGMSSEEYQAWHPSARGNTAISVDTAISAKQLGRLEAIAASQKPQQIVMDVLFLDPGDHLSQKSDPRDPMDAAFVDESHVAVPISPEFASIVASDMKDSIDANLAGKRTKCDISKWHSLGKQARDMFAENSKHDRSLAAVRDAKTAVADKINEGHQASSVHDNPSH